MNSFHLCVEKYDHIYLLLIFFLSTEEVMMQILDERSEQKRSEQKIKVNKNSIKVPILKITCRYKVYNERLVWTSAYS